MKYSVSVDGERCKGCELCVAVCPRKVLAMGGKLNASGHRSARTARSEDCIGCEQCALICPDGAIAIEAQDAAETADAPGAGHSRGEPAGRAAGIRRPATANRGRKTTSTKSESTMAEKTTPAEERICRRGC